MNPNQTPQSQPLETAPLQETVSSYLDTLFGVEGGRAGLLTHTSIVNDKKVEGDIEYMIAKSTSLGIPEEHTYKDIPPAVVHTNPEKVVWAMQNPELVCIADALMRSVVKRVNINPKPRETPIEKLEIDFPRARDWLRQQALTGALTASTLKQAVAKIDKRHEPVEDTHQANKISFLRKVARRAVWQFRDPNNRKLGGPNIGSIQEAPDDPPRPLPIRIGKWRIPL